LGRFDQTKKDADVGAFKTPTLRDIAARAPYFHDGSFPTLKDALGHYVGGGNANAHLDKEIRPIDFLSFDERDDLLVFLNSLTATLPANLGPPADLQRNGAKANTLDATKLQKTR
jgi:cytochrome c peroxidase